MKTKSLIAGLFLVASLSKAKQFVNVCADISPTYLTENSSFETWNANSEHPVPGVTRKKYSGVIPALKLGTTVGYDFNSFDVFVRSNDDYKPVSLKHNSQLMWNHTYDEVPPKQQLDDLRGHFNRFSLGPGVALSNNGTRYWASPYFIKETRGVSDSTFEVNNSSNGFGFGVGIEHKDVAATIESTFSTGKTKVNELTLPYSKKSIDLRINQNYGKLNIGGLISYARDRTGVQEGRGGKWRLSLDYLVGRIGQTELTIGTNFESGIAHNADTDYSELIGNNDPRAGYTSGTNYGVASGRLGSSDTFSYGARIGLNYRGARR